jgi:multidrug resistance efflux pump
MRRWLVALIGLLGVLAVVALLVGGTIPFAGSRVGASATPLPPVPASDRVVAEARAVPARTAELGVSVPGVVARVSVGEGDTVAAGAPLLALDGAAADANVAAARATLDAAAARVDQASAAASQADAEVNRAQAAFDVAKAGRDQVPSTASSAQKRAADAQVHGAQAGVASARAARDGLTAAARAAEADRARAAAALVGAQAAASALQLSAPFAGTVASVDAKPGDVVAAGPPLIRIAAGGWTFHTTDLGQDAVASIAVGNPATVTVDGFGGSPIAARVTRIASVGVDSQGDILFTVVLEPTGTVPDGIRWNMKASAQIATRP